MECRIIQINLLSASNLQNVREVFEMKVYAAVTIAENSDTTLKTPVDKENKSNPVWNCAIKYTISEKATQVEGVKVAIKLYCKRTLGDRYIGEIQTSIKQLYDQANSNGDCATLTYQVHRDSQVSQGELNISCKFGETMTIVKPSRWKRIFVDGTIFVCDLTVQTIFAVLGA